MTGDTAGRKNLFDTFDSLTIDELRQRRTAKWSFYPDDVLPAWVAEMDFPVAPVVREALHEAVERSFMGYPPKPEDSGLPEACAAWLSRAFGLDVAPRQLRILPDALQGIELAIEAFSREESPVVILTPSYPPFFEVVRVLGRQILEVPMATGGDQAVFDLDAINTAVQAGAGTVILCNPHNPLGRAFRRDELVALATIVEAHGARVVADELHAPFVYPGVAHVSYATVSETAAHHSVTLVSASKGWNLPGLKCAQVVLTNEADCDQWDKLSYLRTRGASILGILANKVAFEQGGPWLRDVVTYLDGNRQHLADLLGTLLPQMGYAAPEATYFAWLDCRAFGLDDPASFFLQHAKVALSDGASFGDPGRGYVRLNFATSRALLTTIVQKIAASLAATHSGALAHEGSSR